jgi:hypothetical protein
MTAPDTTPKALRALAKEVDALIVDWDRREIRERAVAALLAVAEECQHEWVDARNEYVASGEICLKCRAVRAGNAAAEEPKP